MPDCEPKFENLARIPIVLHIGRSGKKTHLSYADIDRCNDTGELCVVPYASMCGSAKWSVHSGRSGETMMQHTGKAHITCKKCGVKDVELNPQGFDVDHMRTYHEVYADVKIKNILNSLGNEENRVASEILDAYDACKNRCGVSPRITINGKLARVHDSYAERATTPLEIAIAMYDGAEVCADVWDKEKNERIRKTIRRNKE